MIIRYWLVSTYSYIQDKAVEHETNLENHKSYKINVLFVKLLVREKRNKEEKQNFYKAFL